MVKRKANKNATTIKAAKKAKTKAINDSVVIKTEMENESPFLWLESDWEIKYAALTYVAVYCEEEAKFWLGELLDDCTEKMLISANQTVGIMWLTNQDAALDRNYRYGFEDQIDVQSILCDVYLVQKDAQVLHLTDSEYDRILMHVKCVEGEVTIEALKDIVRVPPKFNGKSKTPKIKKEKKEPKGESTRKKKPTTLKKKKKDASLQPFVTTISSDVVVKDQSFSGRHPFRAFDGDTFSASRELIRAVLTKNYPLLRNLLTKDSFLKQIHSLNAYRSADIKKTARDYAIEQIDFKAIEEFRKLEEAKSYLSKLSRAPKCLLHSSGTGRHTSRFSNYNRREIGSIRGNKQGNDALLDDQAESSTSSNDINAAILQNDSCIANLDLELLNFVYPKDGWLSISGYMLEGLVKSLTRSANTVMLKYLVEILERRGGWGYNKLHVEVLNPPTFELTKFRKVSILKKANSTQLRPIHFAAVMPESKHLEALIDEMSPCEVGDWNIADVNGWKTIHYAAISKSADCLKFLLALTGDIDLNVVFSKHHHCTPLHLACKFGRTDNVRCLLEYAQKKNTLSSVISFPNKAGERGIHIAAANGHAEVLLILSEFGDANSLCGGSKLTPLCLAVQNGHSEAVSVLLEKCGAKVNLGDKFKKSPLMYAVKNGHTKIAITLINAGANLNAEDTSLNSVTHYAAAYGWVECVQLMIDSGAECWSKNIWKVTPMSAAALKGRFTCSHLLLENAKPGENAIDFQDSNGLTLVAIQCQEADNEAELAFYLNKNANPNIADIENVYPIEHLVNRKEEKEVAKSSFLKNAAILLLDNGASLDCGETPVLIQAMINNHFELVELFITKYSADVNVADKHGKSCLMYAVGLNSPDAYINLLLKYNASTTMVDEFSNNVFHYLAEESGKVPAVHFSVVKKLFDHTPDPIDSINCFNYYGYSPVMSLASNERPKQKLFKDQVTGDVCHPDGNLFGSRFSVHNNVEEKEVKVEADYESADENYTSIFQKYFKYVATFDTCQLKERKWKEDEKKYIRDNEGENIFHFLAKKRLSPNTNDKIQERFMKWHGGNLLDIVHKTVSQKKLLDKFHLQKELDKRNIPDQFNPLFYAVNQKNVLYIETILQVGADPNLVMIYQKQTDEQQDRLKYETTCLINAVELFEVEIVKLLLKHGADYLAIKLPERSSILHIAMQNNSNEVVDVILDTCSNIKLDAKNNELSTPLLCAVQQGQSVNQVSPHAGLVDYSVLQKLNTCPKAKWWCCDSNGIKKWQYSDVVSKLLGKNYQNDHEQRRINITINNIDYQIMTKKMEQMRTRYRYRCRKIVRTVEETAETLPAPASITTATCVSLFIQKIATISSMELRRKILETCDVNGRTVLHYAAKNRDMALLRAILTCVGKNSSGIINATDLCGRTPLHLAVNSSPMRPDASFEIESFLIKSGADCNIVDKFGFSVLHFALLKIDIDFLQMMKQTDEKQTDEYVVNFMLSGKKTFQEWKGGATINPKKFKESPLFSFLNKLKKIPAEEADPIETLSNFCLVPGIEVNIRDVHGRSPLHLAAAAGSNVCTLSLLHVGCNIEETCKNKNTPLGMAMAHNRKLTAITLLQQKANIESTFSVGDCEKRFSYYFHAVKNSWQGLCHLLLNAGFSYHQAMEDSICNKQLELCRNLLFKTFNNAVIVEKNETGQTLLHVMAMHIEKFEKIAEDIAWELVDAGVECNAVDNYGNTAIHYATVNANIKMCHFFKYHNCPLSSANTSLENPLLYLFNHESKQSKQKLVKSVNYFENEKTDLDYVDLKSTDSKGRNLVCAFIENYVGHMKTVDFVYILHFLLSKGIPSNVEYESTISISCGPNSVKTNKLTPLIRSLYIEEIHKRSLVLSLLLSCSNDKDSLMLPDGMGNSLLMHCVVLNRIKELRLIFGEFPTVNWYQHKNATGKDIVVLRLLPNKKVLQDLLRQVNFQGKTVFHLLVNPVEYGSYENVYITCKLALESVNLDRKDKDGNRAIVYAERQKSWEMLRCLTVLQHFNQNGVADVSKISRSLFSHESRHLIDDRWPEVPNFETDAKDFIDDGITKGLVKQKRVELKVSNLCDFGNKLSLCYEIMEIDEENGTNMDIDEVNNIPKHKIDGNTGSSELDNLRKVYYDVTLSKVDILHGEFGQNVFYNLQVIHEEIQDIYVVFTNWGRIGEEGKYQQSPFNSRADAIAEFMKIFRSKTGNQWKIQDLEFEKKLGKYMLMKKKLVYTDMTALSKPITEFDEVNSIPFSASMPSSIIDLLKMITNIRFLEDAARNEHHDLSSMPLGTIEKDALLESIAKLIEIRDLIEGINNTNDASDATSLEKRRDDMEEVARRSSRYYEIVPFGENSNEPISAFNTVEDVNKEISRIKKLIDIAAISKIILGSKRNMTIMNPLEYCYNSLQIKIDELPSTSAEYNAINDYFFASNSKNDMEIRNIFIIKRRNELETDIRGDRNIEEKVLLRNKDDVLEWSQKQQEEGKSTLLWHGTRTTNLMSILSGGLRIAPPEAPHSGFAFGKGIYFADAAAKSLNYCSGDFDQDGSKFLLLCDVRLGKSYETKMAEYMEEAKPGFQSTKALGITTPDPDQSAIYSPDTGSGMLLSEAKNYPSETYSWQISSFNYKSSSYIGIRTDLNKFEIKLSKLFVDNMNQTNVEIPEDLRNEFIFEAYEDTDIKAKKMEFKNIKSVISPYGELRSACCDVIGSFDDDGECTFTLEREICPGGGKYIGYNEYIVYKESQAKLRYLLHVGPKKKQKHKSNIWD